MARRREESGDYEGALDALSAFFGGVGTRPSVVGLSESVAAELLLRAGTLTSNLGFAKQIADAQEAAKDLLSESRRIYEELGDVEKTAEATTEIALCYWREGQSDNALILLDKAIELIGTRQSDVKALALLRKAIVEAASSNLHAALKTLTGAAELFVRSGDSLVGRYYMNLASILKNLGEAEGNQEYTDRALIEYAAASHYLEAVGHRRYLAMVQNQLGFLLYKKSEYDAALDHLERARKLFTALKDRTFVAQVNDTRARLLFDAGMRKEALAAAHASVRALKGGDALALLVEALTTLAFIQIRCGSPDAGRASLDHAVELAERIRSQEALALAVVTLLEELGDRLTVAERLRYSARAMARAGGKTNTATATRLASCCRSVMCDALAALIAPGADVHTGGSPVAQALLGLLPGEKIDWESVSLQEKVEGLERAWITRALAEAEGAPTKASRLLGLPTPWSLTSIIQRRHSDLLAARTPLRVRRKSIIKQR